MSYTPEPVKGTSTFPYEAATAAAIMRGRAVTTRQYRMECVSCQGSGHSQRCLPGLTNFETCQGCEGKGHVWVTETTVTS